MNAIKKNWGRSLFFIKAFLCLVNEKWYLDDLVEVDFRNEMVSNNEMPKANEEIHVKIREEIKRTTLDQRRSLLEKLWGSFCWILSAMIFAIVFIVLFRPVKSFDSIANRSMGIISIFCFSFATLARLGWEVKTPPGDTVFEKFDEGIFWFMYFIGTFAGVVSVGI